MDNYIKLIVLIILLLLSAFFSSAETALTTISHFRLKTLSDKGHRKAKLLLKITSNSSKMLSAILIGNNIVNLQASALATVLAQNIWGNKYISIATGILTFLVLIFGEIIPKTVASLHPEAVSFAYADIIYVLIIILTPVIIVVDAISGFILMLFHIDKETRKTAITESELRTIVNYSQKTGVIEEDEEDIINNVFDLSDALAKDIMVPRIDMTSVSINTSLDDFLDICLESKYTRLPVYEDRTDNVIGFINIKDVFFNIAKNYKEGKPLTKEDFHIKDYIREAIYTFEQKNLYELLEDMRLASINLAVVLDDYSTVSGIVTLEDILEELVGEIRDEFDQDEVDTIRQVDKTHYLVKGITRIEDFNDYFDTSLTSEDNDSISGVILEKLDRIPSIGDTVEFEGLTVKVVKLIKRRIDTLIVYHTTKEE